MTALRTYYTEKSDLKEAEMDNNRVQLRTERDISAGSFGGFCVTVNRERLGFPHFCYCAPGERFAALFLLSESPPESCAELAGQLLGYAACSSCCSRDDLEWLLGWLNSGVNFDRLWELWRG